MTEWHAYDGRYGRPRAAFLRGSCSCGWRGAAEYPLDRTTLPSDKPLYEADVDLSGPIADYEAHLSVIREKAVPLAEELTALLTELVRRPDGLASEEPLVVLRLSPTCGTSSPRPARTRHTNSPPGTCRSRRSRPPSARTSPRPAATSPTTSAPDPSPPGIVHRASVADDQGVYTGS
ncbi:hypothetical protein ACIBTP_39085 [Streptomyces avidinii]|uniref:hypothetical protein n=1 Tax=Streptomyces avidinii TaxID=1895 RepID=UPI0037A1A6CE